MPQRQLVTLCYLLMDGSRFSTEITVRFAETDAQGIAHNASYLVWYEVARIAYLARFRDGYRTIQEEGYEALTIESHVRYLKPVFFDDRLTVSARVAPTSAMSRKYSRNATPLASTASATRFAITSGVGVASGGSTGSRGSSTSAAAS